MASVKLFFCASEKSNYDSEIECFANNDNDIFIRITNTENLEYEFISLDKETAIKFSRELRKQISLI